MGVLQDEYVRAAIQSFSRSIDRDPKRPEYHFHLEVALSKAGRPDEARQELERALQLRPDYVEARTAQPFAAVSLTTCGGPDPPRSDNSGERSGNGHPN
jgi:tetratricopeptide (TPR) repeat protein